jgi:protein-tyrosine-phosphatase
MGDVPPRCRSGAPEVLRMSERPFNVLFLCTGNSARSILAESLIDHWGKGRFVGYSAGSYPKGTVHPMSISLLDKLNMPTEGLRSKSWDEFAAPDSPTMDFVFTVCDNAVGEACPVWLGHPVTAHWGVPDPAAVEGTELERREAFRAALRALENRIKLFTNLPIASLDRMKLEEQVRAIGKTTA